jgi:hypothetical protein
MRILDRLERTGWDVLAGRPALGAADVPRLATGMVLWAGGRGRMPRGAES